MLLEFLECSRLFPNVPECSRMFLMFSMFSMFSMLEE